MFKLVLIHDQLDFLVKSKRTIINSSLNCFEVRDKSFNFFLFIDLNTKTNHFIHKCGIDLFLSNEKKNKHTIENMNNEFFSNFLNQHNAIYRIIYRYSLTSIDRQT